MKARPAGNCQPNIATQKHTLAHVFAHKVVDQLYTHVHTYVSTHRVHVYTFIHIHTYIHTYIDTYIHTYIHTYVHTYIHTYICMYCVHGIQMYMHVSICTNMTGGLKHTIYRHQLPQNFKLTSRFFQHTYAAHPRQPCLHYMNPNSSCPPLAGLTTNSPGDA